MCFPPLYAVHLPYSEEGDAEGNWDGLPFYLGVLEGGIEPRPKRLFAVEVLVEAWTGRREVARQTGVDSLRVPDS